MNVSASLQPNSRQKSATVALGMVLGSVLILSGCAVGSWKPKMSLKDLRLPANSEHFRNRFYAGIGLGMSQLKPDAQPPYSAGTSSSSGSQIQLGYDLNNSLALEFQSSVLGEAELDSVGANPIQYSGYSGSALLYALGGADNRNRRLSWSGYGRLGVALNRQGSNVDPLNGSSTDLLVGAGIEYGFGNGLGVRGELVRYSSDASFVGLGAVYRFDTLKKFVPKPAGLSQKQPTISSRFENSSGTDDRRGVATVTDAQDVVGIAIPTQSAVGRVRVLASASDYDVDGVANEKDQCGDTAAGTAVDQDGCGLFDGTLANSTFTNGSAKLEPNLKASLDNLALRLVAFPEVRLAIEGHTDGKGHEQINLNVSRTRATMVRNYLVRKGVAANQLDIRPYGETRPVASNETEQGRDLNRRIEFVTLPSLTPSELSNGQSMLRLAQTGRNKKTAAKPAEKSLAEIAQSLKPRFAAATTGIDILPATRLVPGLKVSHFMQQVAFLDKGSVLTADSNQPLADTAKELRRYPDVKLMLAAHTNVLESDEANLQLSEQQASSVVAALVKLGVNRRQLVSRGFGDSLPLVQVVSDADRVLNQRIELRPLRE